MLAPVKDMKVSTASSSMVGNFGLQNLDFGFRYEIVAKVGEFVEVDVEISNSRDVCQELVNKPRTGFSLHLLMVVNGGSEVTTGTFCCLLRHHVVCWCCFIEK